MKEFRNQLNDRDCASDINVIQFGATMALRRWIGQDECHGNHQPRCRRSPRWQLGRPNDMSAGDGILERNSHSSARRPIV